MIITQRVPPIHKWRITPRALLLVVPHHLSLTPLATLTFISLNTVQFKRFICFVVINLPLSNVLYSHNFYSRLTSPMENECSRQGSRLVQSGSIFTFSHCLALLPWTSPSDTVNCEYNKLNGFSNTQISRTPPRFPNPYVCSLAIVLSIKSVSNGERGEWSDLLL